MKSSVATTACLAAIRLYQHTLSPDHGLGRFFIPQAGCRYYPSCSMYAYEAVAHWGVRRGLWRAFRRLGRCHPWAHGGYDPVTS